ncbi:MAG: DNA helicase RecQ [Clostridiales Family XIII bacterium]|nr:DNA helicase RecQ [Clostridiales Family XIII bacterium]
MKTAIDILKEYFGYDSFRDGQEEIIDAILAGRDALGVMPTGAGKSICYQVPAMLMKGMVIVISPLISLMKDQVQSLEQAGIPAECINSGMNSGEYEVAMMRAANGNCDVLYVAPERLDNPEFLEMVGRLNVSMVTVDEAHCVSQWGQDFRPSYLKIADFIAAFPNRPVVSAFTATATAKVREDVIKHLALREPYVCVTGFNRENLFFEVRKPADKARELLSIVRARSDRYGIIYCSTRKTVEEVCVALQDSGYAATRYHAGLGDAERRANQDDFRYDRKTIMVATNAFGMGIDKSNVGYVIHYNMPKNIESYYQEAGRAGRDGSPADCILLYGAKDVQTNRFLIERGATFNEELTERERASLAEKDLDLLKEMTFYAFTTECLRGYILKYFGERADLFCGNCGSCNTTFEEVDMTLDAQKIVSCVHRICKRGWPYGKSMIADVLKGSANEKIRNAGFDKLPTYGIMTQSPKRRIIDMIDYLDREGYLNVSDDRYPVVKLGARAEEITKERRQIIIKMPKHIERKPEQEIRKGNKKRAKGADFTDFAGAPASEALFQRLREVRRSLADEADVPAFVVFSDAALMDMCRRKPVTEDAFLAVSGVGEQKLARYGTVFIGAIEAFLKDEETA